MKFAAQIICGLLAAVLSSCGGELSQFGQSFGGGDAPTIEKRENNGDVELILHPVAVWDERGVSKPKTISIDGADVQVRLRKKDIFEKSFVQIGLFWHSRKDNIFMPVAVAGPSVDIRQVEIRAGGNFSRLRRAQSFNFTPAQSSFGGDKISSAAFEMKPAILSALVAADTAQVIIKTSRGNLILGLDVVTGNSESHVRGNARRLFGVFAAKIATSKRGG